MCHNKLAFLQARSTRMCIFVCTSCCLPHSTCYISCWKGTLIAHAFYKWQTLTDKLELVMWSEGLACLIWRGIIIEHCCYAITSELYNSQRKKKAIKIRKIYTKLYIKYTLLFTVSFSSVETSPTPSASNCTCELGHGKCAENGDCRWVWMRVKYGLVWL